MQIQQNLYFNQNNQLKRRVNNNPTFGYRRIAQKAIMAIPEYFSSAIVAKAQTSIALQEICQRFPNAKFVELPSKKFFSPTVTAIDLGPLPEGATYSRYLKLGARDNEISRNMDDTKLLEKHMATTAKGQKEKEKSHFEGKIFGLILKIIG